MTAHACFTSNERPIPRESQYSMNTLRRAKETDVKLMSVSGSWILNHVQLPHLERRWVARLPHLSLRPILFHVETRLRS